MSLRGYSYRFVKAVEAADAELIGVQLGLFCINNDVPVNKIAKHFDVSRMTIYSWFTGLSKPHARKAERIAKFLRIT